jgi:hypothetical protein
VPTLVQSMDIAELKGQLLNVHSLFPNADPLEVMFFATAPVATLDHLKKQSRGYTLRFLRCSQKIKGLHGLLVTDLPLFLSKFRPNFTIRR